VISHTGFSRAEEGSAAIGVLQVCNQWGEAWFLARADSGAQFCAQLSRNPRASTTAPI
jgi:hypothetical protein